MLTKIIPRLLLILSFIFFVLFFTSLSYGGNYDEVLIFTNEKPIKNDFKKYAYLTGAVQNPGVYEIKDNERLIDLIIRSGGLLDMADQFAMSEKLNLSAKLKDEEKIFIPFKQEYKQYDANSLTDFSNNNLININLASKSELESLPGIGSVLAQRIIENRPFESLDDLKRVPGISDNKLNQIRSLIII